MDKETLLIDTIFKYEIKFNGWLKVGYKNDEKFLNDLTNEIKINGINEILEYYYIYLRSINDKNSSWEKWKAIEDLIDLLEKY